MRKNTFSLSSEYEISQTHFHKRNVASAFFYLRRCHVYVVTSAPGVEQRDVSAKMELFYAELTRIVSEGPCGIGAIYVSFGLRLALASSFLPLFLVFFKHRAMTYAT